MAELFLIRHGKTQGNLEGRYVGKTDESLCEEGIALLTGLCAEGIYPETQLVCASPMKRCLETSKIIYKGYDPVVIEEFRETDFGAFEYKNYDELNGNPVYQAWIDSNGTMDIPEAECTADFERRIRRGFARLSVIGQEHKAERLSCVVHGGVIMKLMNLYSDSSEDYYHWQVKNGRGIRVLLSDKEEKLTFIDWI